MYEWLEREIAEIKTPHFHLVDRQKGRELSSAIATSPLGLPDSYKRFVLQFGEAKLYRNANNGSYNLFVFAGPIQVENIAGETLFRIAEGDNAVYVKPRLIESDIESQVYEIRRGRERVVDSKFDTWLENTARLLRESFGGEGWARIVRGPDPFSDRERAIVTARRKIAWRVAGTTTNGDTIFDVSNHSSLTLPYLMVGVQTKDRRLNGAVALPIGSIKPGTSGTVVAACYKSLVSADEIEIFSLPDPAPEDRERYWEFKEAEGETAK